MPTLRHWRSAIIVSALATLLASGCAASAPKVTTAPVVTFAEQPGATPNYIFPMYSDADFTYYSVAQFEYLMYRPLYWFGNNGQPTLNEGLSIGNTPTFSDGNRTVTITMKHWIWSNGQPVTARDVVFWLNLLSAVTDPKAPAIGTSSSPGPSWGAFVPKEFPQNVTSYQQTGTYSFVLHLNAAYNPVWFEYNELSQIIPIPQAAWDKLSESGPVGNYDSALGARIALAGSSPGQYVPSNPGTASSGALGVAAFLNSESLDLATYATNPLWKVVDGPFKLAEYTTTGFIKLVPNKSYSGAPKPTIGAFEELPFTSQSSEYSAVADGSLTIGYVPQPDLGQLPTLERRQGYKASPWYAYSLDFIRYNFTNQSSGPIFSQLYFRQAFQSLVDQPLYIKQFWGGVGTAENGPVPAYPSNSRWLSSLVKSGEVYPYAPTHAASLLRSHGWTVVPGGTSYCSAPGTAPSQCGPGVKGGQKAAFKLLYVTGSAPVTNEIEALQSDLAKYAGISLTLVQEPLSQIAGVVFNNCTPATPCNTWDLANYGVPDWTYFPDNLPTGGEIYGTGASGNSGDYSSPTNDANIQATHVAGTVSGEEAAMYAYENYLARQLPSVWVPNVPWQITVYKKDLSGVVPQGIFQQLNPEAFRVR